ncbi:MAG TPA: class I SAM-dependent methyltransferase [Thiolapillus brandeum]|uniref:Class I SAM-dependent methyltransferase n=1 Tax=Thiolapillus brandeum TaxID=1076588 RepID=A0A831K7N5_9GAMM|nr:class I SAM-dependent methyltransferase [Thiolapillus brandeum]
MSHSELMEKWDQRHQEAQSQGNAAQVLLRNMHLLPTSGKVLDLACGRGANAMLLARSGLETHAWDFSSIAIDRLREQAVAHGLNIATEVRDVIKNPPEAESFDLILVSFFLERQLIPYLQQALRPGGLIYYQTFVRSVCLDRGPSTDEWRLGDNELLRLFAGLHVHYYREDGLALRDNADVADLAMMVASKGD